MNDTYEQEIDLKDLLFFVLSKWRLIIGVTLVFAILLGGYQCFKGWTGSGNEEYVAELKEQYEKDINIYEESKSDLELQIETLSSNIDYEVKYEENSLLFQIDANNSVKVSADVFITMDAFLSKSDVAILAADPADTVVKAYASIINSSNFLIPLSEQKNIDIIYLKELVQVQLDYQGNMLTITVTHKDQDTAEKILDLALESMKSAEGKIEEQMGEHSIIVLNQSTNKAVDTQLLNSQNERRERLKSMRQSLREAEKSLTDLMEPEEPSNISRIGVLKSGIKYGVLGGVLGAFASVFVICILFLMSSKVYSENELKKRFGLKIFGVFNTYKREKSSSKIDVWLARLEGKEYITDDAVSDRVTAHIRTVAEKDSRILLTGTVPDCVLQELKSDLQAKMPEIKFSVGYDLNKDTSTLGMLSEHDSIIIVEARGISKYGQIEKEIEMIQEVKKPILGCIVF